MKTDEVFANRRAIALDICRSIRENDGRLISAKYFRESPYSDGSRFYKFSTANYLRLLAADNEAIHEYNPCWISIDDIKNNGWSLREHSKPALLEVWRKTADGEQTCFLQEFYNAWNVLENHYSTSAAQELESIINFFQVRGLIERRADIISFRDCIEAVKKYVEDKGADELTSILAVQTWVVESKLKTKMTPFLPIYPDSVLAEIERAPDKLFESMNKARAILKNLRSEKEILPEKNLSADSVFQDLKVIYHGSEVTLQNEDETVYPKESILMGITAYKFLEQLKARLTAEKFKVWLEFSYKGYEHEKFLLTDKISKAESITNFLRTRLDKNRRHLLQTPQDLKPYIPAGKVVCANELLQQIKFESRLFESVMEEFEQEENLYLESGVGL